MFKHIIFKQKVLRNKFVKWNTNPLKIDNKTKLGMSFFLYNYLQGWLNCTLYNAMTFTLFL